MLPNFKRNTIAAAAALSLAVSAAPAHAWGEKEQNTLTALVAAGVIGSLIYNQKRKQAAASRNYAPQYQTPRATYRQPTYQEPTRYQPTQSSIYATPAARAFNSYSPAERRAIQSRLASWGYYHGGVDGAFGPMTYRAVMAYAGDTQGTAQISTAGGAYGLYDSLIR
ncbi:MAG: peptidoglycan-binding domain-containing protein [Paracoccaceae bacterium]